jgi:hypothetical protein
LSIYQDMSLADIEKEYWDAMKDFPIQWPTYSGSVYKKGSSTGRNRSYVFIGPTGSIRVDLAGMNYASVWRTR